MSKVSFQSSDTYFIIPEENHVSCKNYITMNMRKLGWLVPKELNPTNVATERNSFWDIHDNVNKVLSTNKSYTNNQYMYWIMFSLKDLQSMVLKLDFLRKVPTRDAPVEKDCFCV